MEPETMFGEASLDVRRRIHWVLDHPRMSFWVKQALRGALERDPTAVLNDLEILNELLRADCRARIGAELAAHRLLKR